MASGPQNPNQAIDVMSSVTVTHVVLMVALAVAMIAVIWYGIVLARRRRNAERRVDADFASAERHGATTTPANSADNGPIVTKDVTQDVTQSVTQTVTPAAALPSDLNQIKGLGPKLAVALGEHGITRIDQIAVLDAAAAADLDAKLGAFQGRMARDRWIEQARLLTAGDRAGYEAAFGKLGG